MNKMTKGFAWTRLLCCLMALVMVMGIVLCGCSEKDAGKKQDGIVLGDGDGKMEPHDVVDSVTSIYGTLLNGISGDLKLDGGYTMELGVTIGDAIMNQLESALASQGVDFDIAWLNKLSMNMDMFWNENNMQYGITANINDTAIVSLDVIADMMNSMVYVGAPELNKQYLGFELDMEQIVGGLSLVGMMGTLEGYADVVDALPSEQTLNSLLKRYLDIMLGVLGDPIRDSETLSYGGISQTVTTETYVISRSVLLDMLIKALETARLDKQLEQIIDNFAKWFNNTMEEQFGMFGEWTDVDLHAQLMQILEEQLAEFKELEEELTDMELLRYTVYKAGKEQAGFAVTVSGMPMMYTYRLTSGQNTAFVMDVNRQFEIAGTGTTNGNKSSGTYTISAEGMELVIAELKDFDMDALDRGELKGTVRLKMGEGLEDNMGDSSPIPSDAVIELVLNMTDKMSVMQFNLYQDTTFIAGISMKTAAVSAHKITEPSNYVDGMADIQAWLMGINTNKILTNLSKAGLPSQLIDMLEEALDGAMGGL